MRVTILYRRNSEHAGIVEDYAGEFEHHKGKKLELLDADSRQGADMAQLYDVTGYPTILALNNDGSFNRMWAGLPLPLMDELSYYMGDSRPLSARSD